MDKEKVVGIIKNKIAEHKYEIDQSQLNNNNIQRELAKAKEDLKLNKKDAMITASKLMILKDKTMFHKAAILTLEDVLKDIECL